jgi:hypothetical protein
MLSPELRIDFAGHSFVLNTAAALYWPAQRILTVSDLHLEKSTFLAQNGSLIAPYDSQDTLDRLDALIRHYCPRELLLLGDSFHDRGAWQRLNTQLRERISTLDHCVEHLRWIEGNHDITLNDHALSSFEASHRIENILFQHDYEAGDLPQIIGHYHPKASVSVGRRAVRGKCFLVAGQVLIMPAFGSYTGGLDIRHEAFCTLAQGNPLQPYLLQPNSVVKLPPL